MSEERQTAALPLGSPPEVVRVGDAVHGVSRSQERWLLPDLYAIHVYDYWAELIVDGVQHLLQPGALSIIGAGALMEFRYRGRSEHVFAHLRIDQSAPVRQVPVVQQLGSGAAPVRDRLRAAALRSEPAHRSAELWSVLWLAATRPDRRGRQAEHPAVAAARAYVDRHLADPIRVSDIARASSVSPSHLRRLFHAALGVGVSSYLRNRRAEQAEHLLRESTQPISSIAASVGVPDLQAFNKLCRSSLGAAPTSLRKDG